MAELRPAPHAERMIKLASKPDEKAELFTAPALGRSSGPGHLDGLKPLLNIPDELDVVAVLPFGYPALEVGAGKKNRKPLGEIAHRERFGTPFE